MRPQSSSSALSSLRLAVAGGGVFGLSVATLCARSGAAVTLFEPHPGSDNASRVAAGMLSPAFETLLEAGGASLLALLQSGLAAWPRFAADVGVPPSSDLDAGALYAGSAAELATIAAALDALGVEPERLSRAEAQRRQPALSSLGGDALFVANDGRLDPEATLAAMSKAFEAAGGRIVAAPLTSALASGARFDETVIATGFAARALAAAAPELASLSPIQGQALHYHGGPTVGPVVRCADGYASPQPAGLVFGATMAFGRDDLAPDMQASERLCVAATALFPALANTPYRVRVGVRASTPDGLPLVGRSAAGPLIAVGARRNGWLLAPLVARALVEALQGGGPRAAFDPRRFDTA